jgi:hypothetical protein
LAIDLRSIREHSFFGPYEIRRVVNQSVPRVFGDHLKSIVLGYLDRFEHRLIDHVADFGPVVCCLSLTEVNPNREA